MDRVQAAQVTTWSEQRIVETGGVEVVWTYERLMEQTLPLWEDNRDYDNLDYDLNSDAV